MDQKNFINNKEGFLIYKSFYEPIKDLSDEDLGKLFRMIFLYQLGQDITEVTAVTPAIKMVFEFFKNQFRLDDNKYNSFIELQREKGRKSAEKRWGKQSEKSTEVTTVNHGQPEVTEITYKDKEKDKDKEYIYTKKYFKSHTEEILKEAKEKYPDKNCEQVMQEFLEGIEIKYQYKNYKLAYFKWVRTSNSRNGIKSNGAVQTDNAKYGDR